MYQATYILQNMLDETNDFAVKNVKKSATFPFPVSGKDLIQNYTQLYVEGQKRHIFFPQTKKLDCNSYYRIGRSAADSSINSNWYFGKIEAFEESLVDFYYGCTLEDLCQRYLVIQNPNSKNVYIKSIYIPKNMEQEFCNYYRYIYCNLPYSPHNTVLVANLQCSSKN